jgi:6-phosphogluconolactonase
MPQLIAYISCAEDNRIDSIRIDPLAMTLEKIAETPMPGPPAPVTSMAMAMSPDKRVLTAAVRHPPYPADAFAINPATGALRYLGGTPLPAAMAYISNTANGAHLLGASYAASLVTSIKCVNGVPTGVPTQTLATPDKAHCIISDPTGRFVYVPCLGGDVILRFALDLTSGELSPLSDVPVRKGAGPRHLRFAPAAPFAYCVNELDATIDVYAAKDGALSHLQTVRQLPEGTTGQIAAADIHLTPDGRFLYASERMTNIISIWAVDAATGLLSARGNVPCEAGPRGFAVDPSGRALLCAGQSSHYVGLHAINAATGALTAKARLAVGRKPNWVEFVTTTPEKL